MPDAICRHCADPARKVNRPRGLCWNCFYAPGVRELYPSTSKFAPRVTSPGAEPTLAELDAQIAEALRPENLPAWWPAAAPRET